MFAMVAKSRWTTHKAMMTMTATLAKPVPKKRGQGRPVSGKNDVGRERLLAATEKLLRTLPPARVTISKVAQEAKVDPALVRYYFGNRAALLVEVVDRVTAHPNRAAFPQAEPVAALAENIERTVQLVRRAPFLHRLINDELNAVGTEESRARVREMNLDLVDFYRQLLATDGGAEFEEADPLFVYVAVLGASDFFSSGPLLRDLVPEGTDMADLTERFQHFLVKLVLNGLRKR
jgi:AcrR family transcriptional regulator